MAIYCEKSLCKHLVFSRDKKRDSDNSTSVVKYDSRDMLPITGQ